MIVLGIIVYIAGAGVTHGYAKHRWPSETYHYNRTDDSDRRAWCAWLWPFYWMFIWPFTKLNEVTFSHIEKSAGAAVAKNKIRIAEFKATRDQLRASNEELEKIEAELDKEIAKTL